MASFGRNHQWFYDNEKYVTSDIEPKWYLSQGGVRLKHCCNRKTLIGIISNVKNDTLGMLSANGTFPFLLSWIFSPSNVISAFWTLRIFHFLSPRSSSPPTRMNAMDERFDIQCLPGNDHKYDQVYKIWLEAQTLSRVM